MENNEQKVEISFNTKNYAKFVAIWFGAVALSAVVVYFSKDIVNFISALM